MSTKPKNSDADADADAEPINTLDDNRRKHLDALIRHIKLVQDAAQLMGKRLIDAGEPEIAIILIANSLSHDKSKFHGIEWNHLVREEDNELLKKALDQHYCTNMHHPEYWGGIADMPRIYIAEMVCDIYARSAEQGTDLRGWIKDVAVPKYNMTVRSKPYRIIKEFLDLLLEEKFKKV